MNVKGHDWQPDHYTKGGMVCVFKCTRCSQHLQAFYAPGGLPDLESEFLGWRLIERCEDRQVQQVQDS